MKSADLVAGTVYAIKRGTASWRSAKCGVLLSTTTYVVNKGYGPEEPWVLRPEPKPQAKDYTTFAWGYPVAQVWRTREGEQLAEKDLSGVDLKNRGTQEIDGIQFLVEFHRPQDFASTWAEELVRREAVGRAEAEAKRKKAEAAAIRQQKIYVFRNQLQRLGLSQEEWNSFRTRELIEYSDKVKVEVDLDVLNSVLERLESRGA